MRTIILLTLTGFLLCTLPALLVLYLPRFFSSEYAMSSQRTDSKVDVHSLIAQGNAGSGSAINSLYELARNGNALAVQALKELEPISLVEKAAQGDINAIRTVGWLTYQDNAFAQKSMKELSPARFIEMANKGEENGCHVLRYLCFLGNPQAKKALEEMDPALLIKLTNRSVYGTLGPFREHDAVDGLKELIVRFNLSNKRTLAEIAIPALLTHANRGDRTAVDLLKFFADHGFPSAREALAKVNPQSFNELAFGRRGLIDILEILASYGNISAQKTLNNLR